MVRKITPIWYVVFSIALVSHLAYIWWFWGALHEAFGDPNHPLQSLLCQIYPAFKIKLAEGQIPQILARADSFVWRVWLVVGLSFAAFNWFPLVVEKVDSTAIETSYSAMLLKSWHWIQTMYVLDLLFDLLERSAYATLFQPLPPWKWLFEEFPSIITLYGLMLLYCLGLLGLWLPKWQTRPEPAWICWLVFLLLQMYQLGFGKLEHTYISFTFAGFWLIYYQQKQIQVYLKLARLTVALCYFFAGLEKLLIGGFAWWQNGSLVRVMFPDSTIQALLMEVSWLETVLQTLIIVFQLAAPFLAMSKRYFPWFAAFALCFHLSTFFFMGVGGLVSPWMAALVLFIAPVPTRRKPI